MKKIRVLVVDDAAVMRRLISSVIEEDQDCEVAGIAANGRIALSKLNAVNPDLVTLDVEMPVMDGIETIREIRKINRHVPIIMLSSLTKTGAEKTFEALAAGATDYLLKPASVADFSKTLEELKLLLLPRVKAYFPNLKVGSSRPVDRVRNGSLERTVAKCSEPPQVLCVGASTGGPHALEQIFRSFSEPLPVPGLIVQHMPPVFTRTLAERLDKYSPNRFFEGEEGQKVEAGCVYVAPGGKHMEVEKIGRDVFLRLNENPPENSCRPAVDTLFRTAADVYQGRVLSLVLTGMGQDGLKGCEAIREVGGTVLIQDEQSSVVWGMPRAVWEAGLADEALSLEKVPEEVAARIGSACRA